MKKTAILGLALFCLATSFLFAQVPQTISYQGVFTDANGIAVADGDVPIVFRLHDAEEAGEQLWEEKQTVSVINGIFDVILGEQTPLALAFDRTYWLSIELSGDGVVLEPRIELTASAYSLHARTVADSAISAEKIADGAVVRSINGLQDAVQLQAGSNVSISTDGNKIVFSATGGGSSNVLSQLDAPDGDPVGSVAIDNDGGVGIGFDEVIDETKASKLVASLHVRSANLGLTAQSVVNAGVAVEAGDATVALLSNEAGAFGSALVLGEIMNNKLVDQWSLVRETSNGVGSGTLRFTHGGDPDYSVNRTRLSLMTNGNMGVGTDSPDREVTIFDNDNDGDAAINLKAENSSAREMLIAVNQSSGGLISMQTDNDLGFRTNGTNRMVIKGNGNVGIGTLNPSADLDVNGAIRWNPVTSFVSYPPVAFNYRENFFSNGFALTNYSFSRSLTVLRRRVDGEAQDQQWFAPVMLPHGARVTSLKWFYGDDTADATLNISLQRIKQSSGNFDDIETMAAMTSKTSGNSTRQTETETAIANELIDNNEYIYVLELSFEGNESGAGSIFYGSAQIKYETEQPH